MKISRSQAVPLILGIAITFILLLLTFVYSLQPLVTIIGVIIGAVISITSQFWAQKLAWKRDYSLKAIEQIYSPLYGVILQIEKILEKKEYENTSFGHWDSCKKDYRYFMVDTKFREKLDSFYERMDKRMKIVSRLETIIIPKIQVETAKEIFPETPDKAREVYMYMMFYKDHKEIESFSMRFVADVKQQKNLDEIAKDALLGLNLKEEEVEEVGCRVTFWKAENPLDLFRAEREKKGDTSYSQYTSISRKLNIDFYNACLEKTAQTPEHQLLVQEEPCLLESAKEIKKELIRRIEEPWKSK